MREITKSVSLKVNLGNYQMVDLFCAVKAEVPDTSDNKTRDEVASDLHAYCVKQITKDRNTSLKYLANLVSEEEKKRLLETEVWAKKTGLKIN